jgi:hypothetical protein
MSLGNGNPKEGDKGSNFNYELKVLQGLEAIAVSLENQPSTTNYGLYAATANSATLTNTTIPGSLVGSGVGSLSVPPNTFKVGDSFHLKLFGHISCANNQQFEITVSSGVAVLDTTGIITLAACTNKHWELNMYFTVRTLGTATVAQIASAGIFNYSKNASDSFQGTNFTNLNNTTFDTTVLNTLQIQGHWFAANPTNSIYSEICILNKLY